MIAGEAEPSVKQKELAKQYVDQFRETARGTTKTALLWAAALAIVWLTGLERIEHDVTQTFNAIQSNNRGKQKYVENQVDKDFKSTKDLQFQIDSKNLLPGILQRHKDLLDRALKKHDDKNAEKEKEIIAGFEKEEKQRTTTIDNYQRLLVEKKARIEKQTAVIRKQHDDLQKELQELRAKKRGVSFDILSQKFEVSPLYAPILWGVFLIGLIVYLLRARLILLALCVRAVRTIQSPPNASVQDLHGLFSNAPWWLAPLPTLPQRDLSASQKEDALAETPHQSSSTNIPTGSHAEPSGQGIIEVDSTAQTTESSPIGGTPSPGAMADQRSVTPIYAQQVREALGWQHTNVMAGLMATIGLFVLGLSQFRVIWLGLEMSRQLGSNHQRAFMLISTFSILFITCFLILEWLRNLHVPDPERPSSDRPITARLLIVATGFIGVVGLLFFSWNRPKVVHQVRYAFEVSLFPLAVCFAAALFVFCVYQLIGVVLHRNRRLGENGPRNIERRQFLSGVIAVIGASGLTTVLAHRKENRRKTLGRTGEPRFVRKSKCRKKGKAGSGLAQGFYLNTKSYAKVVHYVSKDGIILGVSTVCSRLSAEQLKPFPQLSLPARTPSGRNKWREPSERNSSEPVVEGQPTLSGPDGPVASQHGLRGNGRATIVKSAVPLKQIDSRSVTVINLLSVDDLKQSVVRGTFQPVLGPHVHLTSASNAFEQAVIFVLRGKDLKLLDYKRTCELMIYALNHHTYLNDRMGRLPNFRVYDLVAGLSLRYDLSEYYAQLLRLIKEFGLEPLFQSRIEKWQDPNSNWHKRWKNREKSLKWGGTNGFELDSSR